MKHVFTLLICFLALSLSAQVLVEQTFTIEEYVSEVLIGNGVTATNITYTGSEEQIGYLTGGEGLFSVTSGLVLSTDHATHLSDPGCVDSQMCIDCEGLGNDQDLLDVANSVPPLIDQTFTVSSVNDLCILEFDFEAGGDSISFNYVFGSDEYLEWVNSSFNDIFAFFLSGPGISGPFSAPAGFPDGAINIAEVPESDPTLPVTISSVNDITNPEYYIDNFANNGICIDGYTQTFTASVSVQCGEVYHLKLAIADGSDNALESFVLIEEIIVFPELGYACDGECISDVDNDGICDEDEILGCTDSEAYNYNPEATDSDNTLCIYFVPDCNSFGDPGWLDTESGTYPGQSTGIFGEMYNEDIALHLSTTIVEPGSGVSYALDYFDFTSMSGLPQGLISTMTGGQMNPNSEVCVNVSGIPIETGVFNILFTGDAYINVFGNLVDAGVISFIHTLEIGDNPNPISGCTYPGSDNYLVYAMVDDGSCIISGCTDPEASNFHAFVNFEDGSCIYVDYVSDCIEDINQDGTIGTQDLLQLLTAYGQNCEQITTIM